MDNRTNEDKNNCVAVVQIKRSDIRHQTPGHVSISIIDPNGKIDHFSVGARNLHTAKVGLLVPLETYPNQYSSDTIRADQIFNIPINQEQYLKMKSEMDTYSSKKRYVYSLYQKRSPFAFLCNFIKAQDEKISHLRNQEPGTVPYRQPPDPLNCVSAVDGVIKKGLGTSLFGRALTPSAAANKLVKKSTKEGPRNYLVNL